MSGCLDKVQCSCDCERLDPVKEWLRPKRNMFASIIAGTLFAIGWWVIIDASADFATPVYAAFHICGVLSTVALIMINAVSTGQVTGDAYTEGCLGQKGARVWLFIGFVLAFAGLIGSLWVFIQEFLVPAVTASPSQPPPTNITNVTASVVTTLGSTEATALVTTAATTAAATLATTSAHWWQGIAFFIQNLLIFISTLVFKFGRTEEEAW